MKIGIIDADLVASNTKFPNLALMKISDAYKEKEHDVELTTWDAVSDYDKVFVSKVFDYTECYDDVLKQSHVTYGGTGFFGHEAPPLPNHVEHGMPDYELYSTWGGELHSDYRNASIGFTTRGCFRKCGFCVNKRYDRVERWSPVEEFFDKSKKNIILNDDNILGSSERIDIISDVIGYNKTFKYKQGLDIRLIASDVIDVLLSGKYLGEFTFAFDDWDDRKLIERKLTQWMSYDSKHNVKMYVLCGFKGIEVMDIVETFQRIKMIASYGALPYIMRFSGWDTGSMRGMYINLARWCNQPAIFKKMTFREFSYSSPEHHAQYRYAKEFENKFPSVARMFYDIRYNPDGLF